MGTLIVGGLVTLLQNMTNGILMIMQQDLANLANSSASILKMPWVTSATQIMQAVAASLFALKVGWEALSRYILWNEGNPDTDGGQIWKGILRVAMFGAASVWLASNVFTLGTTLGQALLLA